MKFLLLLSVAAITLAGCSVLGQESVEAAGYKTIASPTEAIEIRDYPPMVLAVSPMNVDGKQGQNSAFRNLFGYISGDNEGSQKVAMTAPVLMNDSASTDVGEKIPMTAPVFMEEGMMAFVLPSEYTMDTAPKPTGDGVTLEQMNVGTVAVIRFNGRLDDRADEQTGVLRDWIDNSDYTATGKPMRAGYNAPWTIPALRRNEVLIPVTKK